MNILKRMEWCKDNGGHQWKDHGQVADTLTLRFVCSRCGAQSSEGSKIGEGIITYQRHQEICDGLNIPKDSAIRNLKRVI